MRTYYRDWEDRTTCVSLVVLNALRIAHLNNGYTAIVQFDSIESPDFYAIDGFGAKHCLFIRNLTQSEWINLNS